MLLGMLGQLRLQFSDSFRSRVIKPSPTLSVANNHSATAVAEIYSHILYNSVFLQKHEIRRTKFQKHMVLDEKLKIWLIFLIGKVVANTVHESRSLMRFLFICYSLDKKVRNNFIFNIFWLLKFFRAVS